MKPQKLLFLFLFVYLVAFAYLLNRSLNLEFNGELIALLPADNPHLNTYKKLEQLNSSEGGFTLIIHSKNGQSVVPESHAIKDSLLELSNNGKPVFRSAELENDLFDIRKSALFLMTESELDSLYIEISDYVTQQKLEANPLYVNFDEDENASPEASLEIASNSSVLLEEVASTRRYNMNEDSTVISILFLTDFPKSDYNQVENTYLLLQQQKNELEADFDDLELYWGGSYVDHYYKINDVQSTIAKALIIGILSLVGFLIAYMVLVNRNTGYKIRYVIVDILLVFFVLFSGFIISIGFSSFIFNEINVFTGIIFSILFGINLDYILHLYSINKQHPLDTSSLSSIARSYFSSTKPILLSCLTTGLAIMSLIFAEFEGFIQFGIIFFINIIVNLLSTYLFLLFSPSILKSAAVKDQDILWLNASSSGISKQTRKIGLPLFLLLITVGGFIGAQSLSFNFNFADLEPESSRTSFDELNSQTETGESYHDPTFFVTDNVQESKALFNEIKTGIGKKYQDIERVESFSARYPADEEESSIKAQKVDSIKQLLEVNEEFLANVSSDVEEFIDIVQNSVPPTIQTLPKYIKNRFFYKDGSMAPLVVVYSAMSLSNGQTSIQFRKSSGAISVESGKMFYAASTSMIASSILELLIQESTFLFVVPLITILMILILYYRSIPRALLAATPLLLTIAMMLAIRSIYMFDINLYNVIVFPIIIGVGADNGIHLVDALINNRASFLKYFFSSKFPVLAACSVTTILGFIGLLFIDHPGMESVGILAITGITTTLLATYLTALLAQTFLLKR